MTIELKLNGGFSCLLDADALIGLPTVHWQAQINKNGLVYIRARIGKDRRNVLLHRWIMGEPKGLLVDHINGDTMDNRRQNLRVCNRTQSNQNRSRLRRKTGSPYVGVRPFGYKWEAYAKSNGTRYSFGIFLTPEEAREARNKGVQELHGEFAKLT